MVHNVIIMAGGAGKRLWPASMSHCPKQFMQVGGESSLFRGTIDRAFGLGIDGHVYVVTHENHVDAAVEACRDLERRFRERIIMLSEPIARNTAPALALAAAWMSATGQATETALVMAADHLISPLDAFIASVDAASTEAAQGFIVPYGIVPRGPATGYGYIEAGSAAGLGMEVLSFLEKPDSVTANAYFKSGRYYWNAGLFTYRTDVFLEALASCAPKVAHVFAGPSDDWFETREDDAMRIFFPSERLRSLYANCPAISVDYAVMEKTQNIRMVRADFDWNDVGSWDTVADIDTSRNSPVYARQSSGNFVYADRPVALCGVEDLIVVVSNDRVMICKKGMSQLVRDVAEDDSSQSKKTQIF